MSASTPLLSTRPIDNLTLEDDASEVLPAGAAALPWCSLLTVLNCLGLAASGDEATGGCNPEWRARVGEAWWYRISSFAYCAAGGVTLLLPEPDPEPEPEPTCAHSSGQASISVMAELFG